MLMPRALEKKLLDVRVLVRIKWDKSGALYKTKLCANHIALKK